MENDSSERWRSRNLLAANISLRGGSDPSIPPSAPANCSAWGPTATPLPHTSTSTISRRRPSIRSATKKSPAYPAPAEDRIADCATHPSGRSGITLCRCSRSRSSASIASLSGIGRPLRWRLDW